MTDDDGSPRPVRPQVHAIFLEGFEEAFARGEEDALKRPAKRARRTAADPKF